MVPYDKYYQISEINRNITICFISIPDFIAKFIPHIDPMGFQRRKSIFLEPDSALRVFFRQDEFEKINHFKVLKKQVEWMAGKAAVKKIVSSMRLTSESSVIISAEKSGAPFLVNFQDLNITISHSGTYAVAGVGQNGSPVAVDIEKIECGRMKNISHVAFTDRELEHLQNAPEEKLYLNWTVKEAFLKYIKKGFAEGLKNVEIINDGILHNGVPVNGILIDSEIIPEDYAYTVIYNV